MLTTFSLILCSIQRIKLNFMAPVQRFYVLSYIFFHVGHPKSPYSGGFTAKFKEIRFLAPTIPNNVHPLFTDVELDLIEQSKYAYVDRNRKTIDRPAYNRTQAQVQPLGELDETSVLEILSRFPETFFYDALRLTYVGRGVTSGPILLPEMSLRKFRQRFPDYQKVGSQLVNDVFHPAE